MAGGGAHCLRRAAAEAMRAIGVTAPVASTHSIVIVSSTGFTTICIAASAVHAPTGPGGAGSTTGQTPVCVMSTACREVR